MHCLQSSLYVNLRMCVLPRLWQAVYHNVKPAVLQQQLETIHLTQDKAEAFANAWSTMGQETVEKFRQRILGPLKVQDMLQTYFSKNYSTRLKNDNIFVKR